MNKKINNDRYDDYTTIFGNDCLSRLHNMNIFMIGAGAIGCEYLKIMSLMGIGKNGQITVTDHDQIEKSNLNRQFLFGESDLNGFKSEVACNKARNMNNEFNVIS